MKLKLAQTLTAILIGMSVLTNVSHAFAQAPIRKNLVEEYLLPTFNPVGWNQGIQPICVAYGSLVALSVHASIAYGRPIVLEPNGTLHGGTTVPNYIGNMNNRNYFNAWSWNSPDLSDKYAFSSISVQQIGNNHSAKQAIKDAINNNQPVVFTLRWWKHGSTAFNNFWSSTSTHFSGITTSNNEMDSDGGHAMCIIGYDNSNNTFIVQNSWGIAPNKSSGTFTITQDLNYDHWQYWWNTWPLTVFAGEYRYQFHKLVPAWIMNDTQPPTIGPMTITIKDGPVDPDRPNSRIVEWYEMRCTVSDNIKVSNDVIVKITAPNIEHYLAVERRSNGMYYSLLYMKGSNRMTPPITATVKTIAYDTSGNMAETTGLYYFSEGLPF